MSLIKCPYDDKTKQYIIPTKSWIEPLKLFIYEDINTKSILFISKLIQKEKILVKLTFGRNNKLKQINSLVKDLPNFVYTYCVILCNNGFLSKNKEVNINDLIKYGFCTSDEKSQNITLELMKKYDNSIKTYSKINIDTFLNILKQLIYAQFNAFAYCGFLHNDIHPGNILIKQHITPKLLKYKFFKNKLEVGTSYILADYDNSMLINNNFDLLFSSDFDNDYNKYTLYQNICRTIKVLISLLDKEYKNKVSDILFELQEKYEYDINKNWNMQLIKFLKTIKKTQKGIYTVEKLESKKNKFYLSIINDCDTFIGKFINKIKNIISI
jgi:thiamine kinase-like enzyme